MSRFVFDAIYTFLVAILSVSVIVYAVISIFSED